MLIFCTLIGVVLGEQFWLSAEVNSIDWREGCLTTALCSQPRFQLVKDLLPVNERVSVNWPISEHFVKDSIHPFVTYWPSGKLEDISLSAQVVGIDRTYGFPRICDQTPSIRMFPEEQKIKVLHHHKDHLPTTESPNPPHPDDSLLLNIKGKCFNATLIITKHTERCPWCPDPKDISIVNQEIGSDPNALKTASIYSIFSDERMVHLGVLILAVIAVVSSTAFAIVLVMFLRNKRKMNEKKNKKNPRFHPYISVKGHEMIEDNNRYDMPWEQHNKPLTYWMTSSNKSDSTMTSPLDSASSLGQQHPNELYHSSYTTRDGYQTYHRPPPPMFPPPQTQLFTSSNRPRGITSPISNDDSGLESV